MDERDWLAQRFQEHRPRLRALAYRMLGSTSEADDAVQEAWLRLSRSDADEIENLGGWLTTVVARVSLNMLRSRKVRREEIERCRRWEAQRDGGVGVEPLLDRGQLLQRGDLLLQLLKGQPPPRVITYTLSPHRPPKQKGALRLDPRERERLREHLGTHPGYQPGPVLSGAAAGASSDLTSTCAGVPFRHKISSAFVRRQVSPNLVPALTAVIRKTTPVLPSDVARKAARNSKPSIFGIRRSSRMMSGLAFATRSSATRPSGSQASGEIGLSTWMNGSSAR
jgi:RNA polymerase sigma factor (sigma-70 family)